MVHVCETLASAGFVVAAPEFAECIAGNYQPTGATSRVAIVDGAMQLVAHKHGNCDWGIFGHRCFGFERIESPPHPPPPPPPRL